MKSTLLIWALVAGLSVTGQSLAQERQRGGDGPGGRNQTENPRENPRDNPRRNPDGPNNPGNPDGPNNPGNPNDPDTPDAPDAPGNPDGPNNPGNPGGPNTPGNNLDAQLQQIIAQRNLEPIDTDGLPDISDPLPQLGKQLFFTKNLGGEQSVACVTCHHPVLGGGDDLSLSVGVDAENALGQASHDLLGHGRFNGNDDNNLPSVPRNAPTVFNAGLNETRMFWDGRVERRRGGQILTPDSPTNDNGNRQNDPNVPEGATLAAAQARFPVTSGDEMRGDWQFDLDNEDFRNALASRFDNSDADFTTLWPVAFEAAYGDTEVNFDRIAESIGEYERSMTFVNSPWNQYLNGDTNALTAQEKAGAVLFFSNGNQGAGCSTCHAGSTLSGQGFQLVAFPQFGPGKGNPGVDTDNQDFGRENITGNEADRYHFRAPSLLNIATTAPYGHTGAYQTLEEVVRHYRNPRQAINRYFGVQQGQPFANDNAPFCQLQQIQDIMTKQGLDCDEVYPDAYENSILAVDHLQDARDGDVEARFPLRRSPNLNNQEVAQLVAFLEALTDPCVLDRQCLDPWIIDADDEASFPDDLPLVAEDQDGQRL